MLKLWNKAKAVLKGNLVALNTYIGEGSYKFDYLCFYI